MISQNEPAVRRLWVVTELYYPEETSTGHHMTMIAEGLSKDFEVNVLCGQPNYSRRGTVAPKFETRNGVRIHRLFGTRLNKNVIAYRVINMVTLGLSVFLSALRRFKAGDKILVVTTPPSLPFAVAAASIWRGAGYTLLIHDSYPTALAAAGKSSPDSILVNTWRWFNRWLFKHASKIIVLGRDMKQLTESESEGLDVPVVYIPNWAELELVRPLPRSENRLLRKAGLEDKFVFLYAGNMGYTNDIETIIKCAERLRDIPDIHFIFLGDGSKRGYLTETVEARQLSNITILDPQPRSEQPDFLNACDVAIVSLVNGSFGVSVPSRIYNILAAGKPILGIVESGSELDLLVTEEGVGWCVNPGEVTKLEETIREILSKYRDLADMGATARAVAEEKYSLDASLSCYRAQLMSS